MAGAGLAKERAVYVTMTLLASLGICDLIPDMELLVVWAVLVIFYFAYDYFIRSGKAKQKKACSILPTTQLDLLQGHSGSASTSFATPRTNDDLIRDRATRAKVAEERALKASLWTKTKKTKKKIPASPALRTKPKNKKIPGGPVYQKDKFSTLESGAVDTPKSAASPRIEQFCKPVSNQAPVENAFLVEQGVTRYYRIPGLPHAEEVARLMNQIAREFAPIIKRRGYQVLSVSEMCCCGDGLGTGELGGHLKHVQPGEKIDGHEQENCGGYNQTRYRSKQSLHTIHLRMRHPQCHAMLYTYQHIVEVMCHELAHCVHHNHSKAFYDLMANIQEEHKAVITASHHQKYGRDYEFDVYGSTTIVLY